MRMNLKRSRKSNSVSWASGADLRQLHEAIAREESQEFTEGIIIQEIRRGFLLGGRLLRPAMVKVSSGPGSKKSPVATEKTTAGVEK